jgi:hypothetical protein
MLTNVYCSSGRMFTSLPFLLSFGNVTRVLVAVYRVAPLGRWNDLFDFPLGGKSISSLMMCEVTPESTVILFSYLLIILLSHLFRFVCLGMALLWMMCVSLGSLPVSSLLISLWQPGKSDLVVFNLISLFFWLPHLCFYL